MLKLIYNFVDHGLQVNFFNVFFKTFVGPLFVPRVTALISGTRVQSPHLCTGSH